MDISLPLDKMTSLDKIALMEKLWDDLCRDPESIISPKWHKGVLEAREKEINEGRAKFTSFDRATSSLTPQLEAMPNLEAESSDGKEKPKPKVPTMV